MSRPITPNKTLIWHLNSAHTFDRVVVEQLLEKAFNTWQEFIAVTFQKKNVAQRQPVEDISIDFHQGSTNSCSTSFDGAQGIFAHATLPLYTKRLYIHFDANENWDFSTEVKFTVKSFFKENPNFYVVALHEIGHLLGLTHSTELNSIMNKNYSRFVNKPSSKDIQILQRMYGERNPAHKDDRKIVTFSKVYYKEIILFCTILLVILLFFLLLPRRKQ